MSCNLLMLAHLFQSDDELVDLNDIVIYPGCPVLFKEVQVTSGCSYKSKDKGNRKSGRRLKGFLSHSYQ